MDRTCTCDDSKLGTLKLDATAFIQKPQSQSSSQGTGKNRVVFVVRNEESGREAEPDSPVVPTGSKHNYDLAHLPKYGDLAESEVSAEKKEQDKNVKKILLENMENTSTAVNET